jgi:ferredoxin
MNVHVDLAVCIGSGMCTTAAPSLFVLDSRGGKVTLISETVPDGLEEAVEDAEACCPVEAISTTHS